MLRDERVCVVSGPPAAVAAAVAQAKLVASEGDGPPGPWSDRDGARSVRRGDEGGDFAERVVPCSGLGPGRVIGKGGATVKRLQEDFGVRVDVRAEDGQCFVSGAGAENVDACAAEVARIIEEGDGYVPVGYEEGGHFGDARSDAPRFAGFDPTRARSMGSSSSQTLETLAFRTELEIGRIIGRGGATVRAIEEDTGARVQVDKRTLECVVSGSEAAVASAARTIRRVRRGGVRRRGAEDPVRRERGADHRPRGREGEGARGEDQGEDRRREGVRVSLGVRHPGKPRRRRRSRRRGGARAGGGRRV